MHKQVLNPFLPLTEYVPDGEPHVFGERVYLYGSHDAAGSDRFCVQDYTVWSAPVDDLSDWRCHGVTYRKDQDPRSAPGKLVDYYAPDCVQGNDGRYYLYYVAMGPNTPNFGPMSVAVGDTPAGPFEYVGDICWPDGTPVLTYLTNDPAVLNDDGRIRLYYGWGLGRDFRSKLFAPIYNKVLNAISGRSKETLRTTQPSVLSCAVVELEPDMHTVKAAPKAVLDSKTTAPKKNSALYRHPFYEAPSIRKIGDLYYLVYSSGENNELAYATSRYPDRDFQYRGVIISNADLGLNCNRTPTAPAGTIHGGIECINGQWYIFYHRCTHNTDFSRQACAEPITILPDGSIPQVEITSCGMNGALLVARGDYPAAICCNLMGPIAPRLGVKRAARYPRVCQQGEDVFVTDITDKTTLGYKYFAASGALTLTVTMRGEAVGVLEVRTDLQGDPLATLPVQPNGTWHTATTTLNWAAGRAALYLTYKGSGKLDLLTLNFAPEE